MQKFASTLVAWQRRHGRHDLPWQRSRDPYRVWIAEVMLQQTQVAAVIPYYERFLRRFPTVERLAAATEEEVLGSWSGLGYYARARNVHRTARIIVERHGGEWPHSAAALQSLPGLGRSSAAAIAVFSFGERAPILDGNAKRVLARCFGVEGWPGERAVERSLWALAERLLPARGIERYTQALMDLGATCCVKVKPACSACPLSAQCVARREGSVARLPAARPARPLPTRAVTWLVLLRAGQVLLERRWSSGLWGGLWTFPEVAAGAKAHVAARRLGCEVAAAKPLEWLDHRFTHFRLRARPFVCQVRADAPSAESPGRLWLDLADARDVAVPAPVRLVLGNLRG